MKAMKTTATILATALGLGCISNITVQVKPLGNDTYSISVLPSASEPVEAKEDQPLEGLLWGLSVEAIRSKDGDECAAMFVDAIEENVRPEYRDALAPIVAAIRYSENGAPGREYGCLSAYALDQGYRKQAGECAFTVQKNLDRHINSGGRGSFLDFLGNVYCPVGAENDPDGLNHNWTRNVRHYVGRFK